MESVTLTPPSSPASLWLASGSPRRRALLEQAGFVVAGRAVPPRGVDETLHPGEPADRAAVRLAGEKLAAALEAPGLPDGAVLLAADTLVISPDGEPMGKPVDDADAVRMLSSLAGRCHRVITAVAVGNNEAVEESLSSTAVWLTGLDEATLRAYVATGEPMDKAGAYGIQGLAAGFVERVEGDCSGVVGLPLATSRALLARFGVRPAWMHREQQRESRK